MQGHETIQDRGGTEGERGVVVVDGPRAVVPVFHHLVEVFDLVFAQGSVALDGEPGGGVDGCLQFDTHTVAVLDVRSQVLANVAHGSSLHKLILIVHIEEVRPQTDDVAVEGVAQLIVHHLLSLGGRVGAIVSEVVALWLTMAQGQRTIDAMTASGPREACLGVQEVVFLVDVEALVVITTLVVIELIVDAIRLVAYMTILDIGKHIPLLRDMIGSLQEHVAIELMGIGVVILVIDIQIARCTIDLRVRHPDEMLLHHGMGGIGDIAEVVAIEVLERETPDDIPRLVLVVGVPHQTVGMLCQTFLTNEVRLLDLITLFVLHAQTKLRELVVGTELLVVAIAIGIVQRGRGRPVVVDVP